MLLYFKTILLVLWALAQTAAGNYCPTSCNCIQRTIRCIRARLTTIPRIPTDSAVLDLRFNHFEEIPAYAFEGLDQVTSLFLSNNEIANLHEDAFNGLNTLRYLYISNNRLSRLPTNVFRSILNVEEIHLNNNQITEFDPLYFLNLPKLHNIYLTSNRITKIPKDVLKNLPTLKILRLDGNNIDCDCNVYSFWQHYQQHPRKKFMKIYFTCASPAALSQLSFYKFREEHFRCSKPILINAPHDMLTRAGDNVELPCGMSGDPAPEIIWMQNTNQISDSYAPRMQIMPSGNLRINSVDMNDIGVYECIGRNEMGETKTQAIQMMVENPNSDIRNHYNNNNNDYPNHSNNDNYVKNFQRISSNQPIQDLNNNNNNNNNHGQYNQNKNRQPTSFTQHPNIHESNHSPNIHRSDDNTQSNTNGNYNNENITVRNVISETVQPQFIHRPANQVVALDGDSVILDCVASGEPLPEIKWYFNRREIQQSASSLNLLSNGSLMIIKPTLFTAGVYECEAMNPLGTIKASAIIDVKELPEILTAPQNQTIKVGKTFILECDADGGPDTIISWEFNGEPLVSNERIQYENENTEVTIKRAQIEDSGLYTCVAHNENGQVSTSATISVENSHSKPRLIIEPYDLEAFTGTTIELPCKVDESEGLQLTWRRDGRIIDPNLAPVSKYEISGTGSLFVKNVTVLDTGRYECSVKNEFGRVTASAFVSIKNSLELAPGDQFVRIAFEEAAKEIDVAINNTIDTLFTKKKDDSKNRTAINYADLLRVFRFPSGEARQLARAAEIYERTLVNIRKHVRRNENLTIESDKYEFNDLLSREHLHLVAELSGCMEYREMPNCTDMCFHSKYRTIDGTCNNLHNPIWGASLTAFRRIEKPIYENGFSMPIGWMKGKLYGGYPKPSARLISTELISTKEITLDEEITHMVMQWGQFLDHDLDHAIPSVSAESWDGVDCKKTCDYSPPCYPIEVPPNDPRIKNRRCIDVVRSSSICGSGVTSVFFSKIQNREQINQLTSYIDASQVYGYSYEFSQELRNLTTDEGLLRVGVHFPKQKDMLPFAAPQDGMDCRRNLDENTMNCFVAGDIRVNEQVGLLAMHTIWMREHNRIAINLRNINPHWDGDTLYQEARKIVGAQMQHITYKHWLPLIVGASGMEMLGEYKGYKPNINPAIANEFATAALRFGHTIINPTLYRLNSTFDPIPQGHLPLHKAFFAPWRLAYEGGVDPLMRGMFAVPAKLKLDNQYLNTELTEKLFHTAHAVALDLAAINIQRGRDHGIPGYNVYRKFCNLVVATDFEDLKNEIKNPDIRNKLKDLYGHPDNIDIWVGGILEDQVEGGKVGPLFQCLLIDQFRRLRDGDRFYYENPSVFTPSQLDQIKQANLGRVLCDVGDNIEQATDNIFILPKLQGNFKNCEDIPGINLYFWQDCGQCNSEPPLFDTYIPETYVKRNRYKRSLRPTPMDVDMEPANDIESLLDVNEERVSGLEEVISIFQKEIRKMHKKIHKLEQSCQAHNASAPNSSEDTEEQKPHSKNKNMKRERNHKNHCVDEKGTTRLNNEIWSPDNCTKCNCKRSQISCTHEICPELTCVNNMKAFTPTGDCCPQCVDITTTTTATTKSSNN